jgi:hypothetical protein
MYQPLTWPFFLSHPHILPFPSPASSSAFCCYTGFGACFVLLSFWTSLFLYGSVDFLPSQPLAVIFFPFLSFIGVFLMFLVASRSLRYHNALRVPRPSSAAGFG